MGWLTNKLLLFHFTIPFCFSPLRGRTMSVEWHKVWYWVDVSLNPDLALNCLNSLGVFSYTLKDDVLHSCDIGQCSWQYSSVQSLSRVWLFATPWTAACQASLPITNSQSLLKPMSIESVMSSSVVPFFSCLQSFPASGSFQMSQLFASGGQSTGVSASVLPIFRTDFL